MNLNEFLEVVEALLDVGDIGINQEDSGFVLDFTFSLEVGLLMFDILGIFFVIGRIICVK